MGLIKTIIDAWGNRHTEQPTAEQLSARAITDSVRDRASLGSILTSITPQRIKGIFAEADNGLIGRQIELAQDISERDGHLRTQLTIRAMSVSGLCYEIKAGSNSEGSEQAAEDAREWFRELSIHAIVGRMQDAVHQQYAIERVIWDTDNQDEKLPSGRRRGWVPIASEQVDCRRLAWPMSDQGTGTSVTTPGLQKTWGNITDLEAITPGKYLVAMCDVDRSRPGHGAMVRVTAVLWMLKHFAIIDWAGLVEKFGMPWTIVKYVPGMSDEELTTLLATLAAMRAERVLAVPATASLETTQGTSHTSSPPQEKFIAYIDDVISKVVLGNTTQTDPAGGGAENVSSPTHAGVTRMIRDSDAVNRAEELTGLVRTWFEFNREKYPSDAKAPRVEAILDDDAAETRKFLREVYKQYQADGTVADMLVNATDLKELTRNVGLSVNEDYSEPYLPVRDRTNALVSGETIVDEQGDIVGGDVVEGSAPVAPNPFGQQQGMGNREQGTGKDKTAGAGNGGTGDGSTDANVDEPKPDEKKDAEEEGTGNSGE